MMQQQSSSEQQQATTISGTPRIVGAGEVLSRVGFLQTCMGSGFVPVGAGEVGMRGGDPCALSLTLIFCKQKAALKAQGELPCGSLSLKG
jgi:hypothetical protein